MCRKLLFNNFEFICPNQNPVIAFCQEGPQMLCAKQIGEIAWEEFEKVGFCHFATQQKKKKK